jgi:hypothetical protein
VTESHGTHELRSFSWHIEIAVATSVIDMRCVDQQINVGPYSTFEGFIVAKPLTGIEEF